ncbi:PREDICTED: unconventional myosin-Va-like isoform X6 [Branchiostoma belcheri]|uniref:Unconventional myosin-Va-like isoform X6 n=1 Tax=Branchiostoma belcheri TaxID=7741 RepID=A0A6P4YUN3_BRABE|nr:PREDICTED: unconventional myosin-Va-like isoform X6 [Branchiostoma belcheri]
MTTAELYTKGAQVWVPHPELVWQGAELTKDYKPGDKEMHLETEEERETIVKKMKSDEDLPPLRNPDILVGQNDLTSLSYLHEPAVLYNLQVRFLQNNAIYTYCGIVLVAINPYEQLPLYGNEMVMAYTGQDMGAMDPHIYAVAEEAFRQMQRDERNQSIIVSGESGAGKTVSAKYAMRYFATVGGSSDDMEASIEQRVLASNPIMETNWSQFLSVGEYTAETAIERKVLASNPVMEAIGNAKTIRNDNSSRFGKYIQIGFNKNYTIIGANMRTYLLEKSRIVFQAENERTYHIFYQLCAAADLPEFEDFCLSDPMNFNYTNQGGDPVIKDLDDLEEFHNTKQAMSLLGFSDKIQQEIFRILAALLHLGNIEVDENFKDSEKCYIDPENPHLYAVAELLGVDMNQFRKWMCNRKITAVHQVIEKPLRSSEAMHGRDALAKFLYGQLFDWIVSKINTVLTPQAKENSFIGVLDIYGFEVFEVNSFEQFCINYANEKLQQQFTQHVFKLEQEEYVREEITWSFIDYYDNQPCIDLIEAKLGLLDLLDEECKLPKGSDQNWCQKLYDKHLKKAKHFDKPRMSNSAFIIYHFADKVEYQAEGFLEKNRDLVNEEHINILRASEKFQLVADLVSTKGGLPAPPPAKKGKITMKHLPQKHKQPSKEMRKTVGLQFKESLCLLMETLNSTTPHYVRCIKPNDEKRAFTFEPKRAMQQLRACGVLETIRISSAGYPSRWTYPEFFQRYRVLMVSTEINREDMKNTCATVVSRLIKDPDKFQFGKTKIFFRAGQVAYMEKLRSDKLRACSIMIQKHIRGWLMKRRYQKLKQLALWLQQRTRGILARRYLKWMRETKAATTIQKRFRGYLARSRYLKMRWTILRIQAWGRGKFARIRFLQLRYEVKARLIQRAWRGYVARKRYWHEMQSIILIQSCWRRWLAKKELKKLKIQAKSVDHYKKLNKGMENKIIDLQRKLNEQNKESKELHKKVEVIQDLQTQVTELKKTEEVAKVSSNKVHELEDEITKLKAELDLTKKEKQMLEEEGEIYKEEQEMLNTALKAEIDRLATENKELMEKVALQEEEFQAAHVPELELEKQELEEELAQERSQHQQLIKDYARMEQRYENLRDEMTLLQQGKVGDMDSAVPSPRMHRRAGSDVSSVDLNSESGYGTIGKGEGEEQAREAEREETIKLLQEQLALLTGKIEVMSGYLQDMEFEFKETTTKLEEEKRAAVNELESQMEELALEKDTLDAVMEKKEREAEEMRQKMAQEKDSVVTEMQEELENILAEKQKLKMKIEDKEQEMAETAQKLEEEKEEELARVQEHLEAVETEKENIRREMAKKDIVMKEKLWKLEEEKKALVAEYQDELERLTDDADVLDALLEKKNQEMVDVENKLKTEKSSAVSELQEELEAIQFQREKLKAALDEKEVAMAQTAIKLQEEKDRDLKKVVSELEKEKEKFEAAVGEKESEIVKTKEELRAEKEAALSEMQRQMNEIIGEKEKLSTSLSEKEKEIVESVQKLKAEKEEREAKLLSEISALRKQVQDMEAKYREDMEQKEHEVKAKEETIDSHKAQAVTQESTVHVLMHQIKTLTKRIASMEDKIDDMEFEFQEKTEKLEGEKQSAVTELETQLKELSGQKDSMESLLKSKEREITEAQEKIKTENVGMVAKLQERLETMLAEKVALSQTIKKKDADMADMVRKLEDEKEQAINEVKEQLRRAREEQEGLKNVLGKKEAELSERVRKMEEEKRSLISQFQDQLDKLSDEKDILDALLEKKEQEMVETKQKLEEEKSGTVFKLKQELNDISREREMLQAAIHEKELSMAETSQKLGIQKESAVAEVKEQLEAVKKEREKWKKALEKKERDMTNRITRLEEEKENLATKYEKEVEKLVDDRDMLEAQMEKKDAEMVETQRTLEEEKAQAVRRVSQDLKIIISERMKLKIAIQEKEQMMADASDKLKDEKEKEISGLQTELDQRAEEKEKLQVALERKNSEVSKTKKQLNAEKQAAIRTLKRQLSGIIQEKQKLQKVIVQKEKEISQSMKKIQTQDQAVISELQRKVDEITGVRDKLQAANEKEVSNAVQALEDAISHMDTEEEKEKKRLHLLNLQNHVTKLEQENKDLQEALDVAKMKRFDIANLPEEMSDLVEENKKLKNDISNLRQAVADSNTEEELVKQLDVLTEELMVRREEVLTLKTSMVDQNIENSDQWDKETMTDLDLYLYPPEYLESLNEDGELMQAYLTQKETNRLLEAQMQASKKNAEFQEQELRNEIAALKEENIRQQKLLGQQTDRRDSAWSVHYVPDVDHSNLQLTPEARIEANLQHEITRLTADNLDLREEVENHDKQVRRLKKQIKILMKRQNMQGGDQSALTPDAGSEPSPKEDEGGPHVKTKDDRVFMGMLEYRKEDEQKLIKNLIIDLKPKSAVNMLPGLPAYILFMCIRHADYIGDDNKVKSLLTGTINGIKRVLKKRNEDFETVSFWLANTCRLLHNLKQYSGEESFANQNNKQQNEHCLRNFDLTEYRQVLSDLAVHIYQMMIKIMESKLQPMIVPGMLEHEAIPGVSGGARPSGMRQRTQSISDEMGGRYTLNSILKQLSVFHSIMTTHGMDPELVKQTFRQTFYIIGAGTLNNLLLRKEMCHWSKGMQIRYNVSQLEEWCRDHHLSDSGAIQSLEPVIQAAQLLQVNKKTEEDAKAICDTCKKLSSQQIIKILNLYTPVNEFEERVSISFIRIIQARLKERKDTQSTLLLDTKFSYPVTFPFNPSSLQLDSIQLPEALNVTFLRKV